MKPSTEFIIETSEKALLNLVPLVGGSIASVWGDIQAERKSIRFQEFLNQLQNDLQGLTDQINKDLVSKPDFLDIFELTSKNIINERNENKRILYKNILVNAICLTQSDFDEVEQCIRIIENTTETNIYLLKILSDPDKHNKTLKEPLPHRSGNMSTTTIRKMLVKLLPGFDGGIIVENLKDLEFLGLITPISDSIQNILTYSGLAPISNLLTLKGERLIKYIVGKNKS